MRADQQYHFPFRPPPDVIDVPEDDTKKNDLPTKPQNLHNHPQQEIRLETHLPNE
jgi:cupin superfamily acireductone dioxygenase involved in methionine salvage